MQRACAKTTLNASNVDQKLLSSLGTWSATQRLRRGNRVTRSGGVTPIQRLTDFGNDRFPPTAAVADAARTRKDHVGKQVISDTRRRTPEMLRLTPEKYTTNPVGMGYHTKTISKESIRISGVPGPSPGRSCRAYPVITHTHYMLGEVEAA